MRTLKILVLVFIIAAMGLVSCKPKGPKELIINKWKMKEISAGPAVKIPDSIKNKIIDKGVMEFTKDGKYILSGMDPSEHKGTYSVSEDGKTLTTTPDDTKTPETNVINELTNDKLVITDNGGTKLGSVPK